MKTLSIILSMVIVTPLLRAQDEAMPDWQIMPSISIVKFFQGEDIVDQNIVYYPTYPAIYPYYDRTGYGYSGTGLNFTARCFNDDIKPLAPHRPPPGSGTATLSRLATQFFRSSM